MRGYDDGDDDDDDNDDDNEHALGEIINISSTPLLINLYLFPRLSPCFKKRQINGPSFDVQ